MTAAKDTISFSLPRDWIIEVEMTLIAARTNKPYTIPILLQGSDVHIDVSDLFKNAGDARKFSERFSAKVDDLATKKLESGQVGTRP